MRWSETLIPTLKEDPSDAEVTSHRLMLRAGLMRKVAAGAYLYLPLGLRALKNAERIVREEMDRAGAVEIEMSALQPIDLWVESGRINTVGEDLVKYVDRHGRTCVLGPTHEEVVTDLVRNTINSYKQLPINIYQIQTKFRDEVRPRFGVLRTKEFLMKDAYSFHADSESLEETYKAMYAAYRRICERAGLPYVVVEASSGAIGGDVNHEFMVPCDAGEDEIVVSECGYAANTERAEVAAPPKEAGKAPAALAEVSTPDCSTIKDVSAFLDVAPARLVKTLIYVADGKPVAALVRGDHDLNEEKLQRALGAATLEIADAATVEKATNAPVGYAGPVGLETPLVIDHAVGALAWCVTGANKSEMHLVNVTPGVDFPVEATVDIHVAAEGDLCGRCGKPVEIRRGIEVGHVFNLGMKYSKPLGATFLDKDGKEQTMTMGCYGIGVNRLVAAMIETSHDDKGIIWTRGLAPFDVEIVAIDVREEAVRSAADDIYQRLTEAGVEVLYDDRDSSPGVKFNDADLVGMPLRVVIGKRSLKQGGAEIKRRDSSEAEIVPLDAACDKVIEALRG